MINISYCELYRNDLMSVSDENKTAICTCGAALNLIRIAPHNNNCVSSCAEVLKNSLANVYERYSVLTILRNIFNLTAAYQSILA